MADARTIAAAIIRRLGMPVIPPGHDSADGLPANVAALEAADDDMLEALALGSGRVAVRELIEALSDLDNEAGDGGTA